MKILSLLFIVLIFFHGSVQAEENLCSRILNDYVQNVVQTSNLNTLNSKYKRTISPAADFLVRYQNEVTAAYRPSEDLRSKALSKSRNPSLLQSYIDFHNSHRGTRIPEELIGFLNTDPELAELLAKQRRWIYLSNSNYERAVSLGQELYDLHRTALQKNCGTAELLRLTPCAKIRFKVEALKIKLLPYLNEVKESARKLDDFNNRIPISEKKQADAYLSQRSAVEYELARKNKNENYAILTALEKFENAAALKVETYFLNHSSGDQVPLHIVRNSQQSVVGFAFGKPVDVVGANNCKDLYLLFDLNESKNYFKLALLGHVESRIDLNFKSASRIKTYLEWAKQDASSASGSEARSSTSGLKKYLPAFLGGTSR